jgi:D-sedoheptulose 7-phosphate isomerase
MSARTLVHDRFQASRIAAEAFFAANAGNVAKMCAEMAHRFDRGGRLLVFGENAAASDAHHVAVEFVHPVLVGKRALPALAFTQPLDDSERRRTDRIDAIARDNDIVLAIEHGAPSRAMSHLIEHAGARGLLTLAMSGGRQVAHSADFTFHVACDDALIVQEVQETAYHVFWELVHVFLRTPAAGLQQSSPVCTPEVGGHCSVCGDEALPARVLALDARARSATVAMAGAEREVAMDLVVGARVGDTVMVHQGFAISPVDATPVDHVSALYPFLDDDPAEEPSIEHALEEVRASTLAKCSEIVMLRDTVLREYAGALTECGAAMADRFLAGGKLLVFGNGGSATDAEDVVADCDRPAHLGWRPLPALALTADVAVLSAIANDVGFENVFARQIIAFGEAGDMAIGISTSGNSPNVIAALGEARRRGLLTIALSGDSGGEMAREGAADYCFIARAAYVPRIQEAQATMWHTLLHLIQQRFG